MTHMGEFLQKTAVFLGPRWPVVTFSSRILSYLPTHSRFFFPGPFQQHHFCIQNFRSMHSGGWPFYSSQGHLNLITWYWYWKNQWCLIDSRTWHVFQSIEVPSKKTKLRDYRWTMCYHLWTYFMTIHVWWKWNMFPSSGGLNFHVVPLASCGLKQRNVFLFNFEDSLGNDSPVLFNHWQWRRQ